MARTEKSCERSARELTHMIGAFDDNFLNRFEGKRPVKRLEQMFQKNIQTCWEKSATREGISSDSN